MAIGNSQFDAIMREYDEKRIKNHFELTRRKGEVIKLIPEYKEIEDKIADLARESSMRALDGDKSAVENMRATMAQYAQRKKELLAQFDFPEDYLEPVYECKDCMDTGYIDGQKCHCLKQKILRVMYRQSNIEDVLERENFDTLSYDYYDDSEVEQMRAIISKCKEYVERFDDSYENILFYGNVGVGKTFLTNCIAKSLLDSGHSVIYFTSFQLFDTLASYTFHRDDSDEQVLNIHKDIFDCDLLIIDDLGTENTNSFVTSQMFLILNERDMRKKSTIISTNLSLEKLNDSYTERSFSRIFGNYRIIKPDIADIRIKKKRIKLS